MDWFNNMVRGFGTQVNPFGFAPPESPSQGQVDPAYNAGMKFIGDVGFGMLASGERNPVAALGKSYLATRNNSIEQNKDQYAANLMMQEADAKKQERARTEAERKRRDDFIAKLPPDQRMKAMSIPGYLEKLVEATDPAFRQPTEAKRYNVGGALVDADGNVIYQGQASAGEAPPTKTIYDAESGQEQVVQWNGSEWTPLGGRKAKGDNRASATQLKELWQSEDEIPAIDSTIDSLKTALDLNKKTFTGFGAGVKGYIGTAVPGGSMVVDEKAAKATREFGQIMSYEAIKSMSETLKGATTDRELNQFVEILANPSTPPDIRERTINRMLLLAERQKQIKTQRINELRGSTADQPDVSSDIPDGVTAEEWSAMSEEDRALWR